MLDNRWYVVMDIRKKKRAAQGEPVPHACYFLGKLFLRGGGRGECYSARKARAVAMSEEWSTSIILPKL